MDDIIFRVVNLAWQYGGNRQLVTKASKGVDVLKLVECRDRGNQPVPVADYLGPGWDVRQTLAHGNQAGSLAGTVTAVRRRAGLHIRRSVLHPLSEPGRNPPVQARHQRLTVIVLPDGRVVDDITGHPAVLESVRHIEGVVNTRALIARAERRHDAHPRRRIWNWGGDGNDDPRRFAQAVGLPNHYGVRPMVFGWSDGWGDVEIDQHKFHGSDHWVLDLVMKGKSRG